MFGPVMGTSVTGLATGGIVVIREVWPGTTLGVVALGTVSCACPLVKARTAYCRRYTSEWSM